MAQVKRNADGGMIDAQDELGVLLTQADHWLYVMYGGHLGQKKILHILAGVESMGQKELTEELGIKPGSASEIISKLEKKGDIVRVRDKEDKRRMLLSITEAGREKERFLRASGADETDRKVGFDVLSVEEQAMLKILLRKLLDGWKAFRQDTEEK